ncbi:hypothetical protein NBRC116593_17890 [Sulfitobacter pacificus]
MLAYKTCLRAILTDPVAYGLFYVSNGLFQILRHIDVAVEGNMTAVTGRGCGQYIGPKGGGRACSAP